MSRKLKKIKQLLFGLSLRCKKEVEGFLFCSCERDTLSVKLLNVGKVETPRMQLKDGIYYFCYCAYILRISRYSGLLRVVPTNTGIFLCGLILSGENRTWQLLLVSKKKIGGNHTFFRDKKASIWKKKAYTAFYFTAF